MRMHACVCSTVSVMNLNYMSRHVNLMHLLFMHIIPVVVVIACVCVCVFVLLHAKGFFMNMDISVINPMHVFLSVLHF